MNADIALIIGGRFLQVASMMLAIRLATTRLDPEAFGTLDLLIKATMFTALVCINPAGMFINRRLHAWHARGILLRRLSIGLWALLSIAVLGGSIALAGNHLIGLGWSLGPGMLFFLVATSLIVTTINQTLIPGLNLLGRNGWWLALTLITIWSGLGCAWFLTDGNPSAVSWQGGLLAGMGLGAVLALVPFIKLARQYTPSIGEPALGTAHWRVVLAFVLPLSLVVGLNWFQFQSYRFVLGKDVSLEFIGLFAAGYWVAQGVLSAFETTAQQILFPRFYRQVASAADADQRRGHWLTYAEVMIPLTVLAAIAVGITADLGCWLLIAESYHAQAISFVILGACMEGMRVIGNVYAMAAQASMSTYILILPQAIGASLAVGLVYILLPRFPDPGIATMTALLISGGVYLLSMHLVISRHMKIRIDRRHWQMLLRVLVIGGGMFVAAWLTAEMDSIAGMATRVITCAAMLMLGVVAFRERVANRAVQ
jgi:hypothetical protein